jgi:hypothetical protein
MPKNIKENIKKMMKIISEFLVKFVEVLKYYLRERKEEWERRRKEGIVVGEYQGDEDLISGVEEMVEEWVGKLEAILR